LRFGAHLSIGRGWMALSRTARAEGMESVQAFSRSPRGGKAKDIDPAEASAMRRELEAGGVRPLVIHVPYFVNLATADPQARSYTIETLALDLVRAEELGAPYVVTHLGSAVGGRREALERVASAVDLALAASARINPASRTVQLLLENSGGGGNDVGSRLEELTEVIRALTGTGAGRLGLCLDTCHALVAGYDLTAAGGVGRFLDEVDRLAGLDSVKVLHLNDSRGGPGSHLDRHAAIGKGFLGTRVFTELIAEPQFADIPGILETPEEGRLADLMTLKALRGG